MLLCTNLSPFDRGWGTLYTALVFIRGYGVMTSRIGFFLFVGCLLGALIAQIAFSAAGWGIIAGGVLGLALGGGLDFRDYLREREQEPENG